MGDGTILYRLNRSPSFWLFVLFINTYYFKLSQNSLPTLLVE